MAKYLSVVEEPYRATVEEQDDTGIWFTHAIKNAGADVTVLLKGDAVNYAVPGQDASGLRFGTKDVRVPPDLAGDLTALAAKAPIYVVTEDLADRGIPEGTLLPGIQRVSRDHVARLFAEHDRILHW